MQVDIDSDATREVRRARPAIRQLCRREETLVANLQNPDLSQNPEESALRFGSSPKGRVHPLCFVCALWASGDETPAAATTAPSRAAPGFSDGDPLYGWLLRKKRAAPRLIYIYLCMQNVRLKPSYDTEQCHPVWEDLVI